VDSSRVALEKESRVPTKKTSLAIREGDLSSFLLLPIYYYRRFPSSLVSSSVGKEKEKEKKKLFFLFHLLNLLTYSIITTHSLPTPSLPLHNETK
jgi:hypothetical protein